MIQYGHQSGIAIDATFKTNKNKVNILAKSFMLE
jgi:hypothetical protein